MIPILLPLRFFTLHFAASFKLNQMNIQHSFYIPLLVSIGMECKKKKMSENNKNSCFKLCIVCDSYNINSIGYFFFFFFFDALIAYHFDSTFPILTTFMYRKAFAFDPDFFHRRRRTIFIFFFFFVFRLQFLDKSYFVPFR